MANYAPPLKNDRMACVQTRLDAQSGSLSSHLRCELYGYPRDDHLQKPSFSLSGGVLTMLGVPLSCICAKSGTAALAQLQTATRLGGLRV